MIKPVSIMIVYLTTIIALAILLTIAYTIGFGVSKNKEKGLSVTTIVLLIISAPGVLLNLPSTILYLLQADPQKYKLYNGDDDIDRSFITHCILLTTWVSLIMLYLLYRFWLKYQEKAYREMDSVILEYTSRNGFKTFEEFFIEVKQDRKTAFVSKMVLRNPAFVPENPKLQPYTIPYRNLIWTKYIHTLYQYEISRCNDVIHRYIKQNGYKLPDEFENYCASSNATAVARSIHYPVWTNSGRLENDPFNCIGKSQSPSDYLPYERILCFLYEEIIRQKCIAEMPMIIERYIEDNGYDSIDQFKDSIEMDCDDLADSVLYDSSYYFLEDGSIIAVNCNLYSESIAKRYEEKVTDDYIHEVAEWPKTHRLFNINNIVKGITGYKTFFESYRVTPNQCIRSVLSEYLEKGIIEEGLKQEGSSMYISHFIPEEIAEANGDVEAYVHADLDDDD